jgi:predicted metal-dependent phosphoesterase TrpH
MIVDLHIHTILGSICSQLGPQELLDKAQEMHLDAICITEHHSHRGANKMVEFAAGSGFPVFRGVEIYTELGDMLVYGLKHETRYHLTTFAELVEMAEQDEAVIIPAHPCRGWGRKHMGGDGFPEDVLGDIVAIETLNGVNKTRCNESALAVAEKYGLRGTGGSDAHAVWQVGKCVTVFERDIASDEELVNELREGRFFASYYDDLFNKKEESA